MEGQGRMRQVKNTWVSSLPWAREKDEKPEDDSEVLHAAVHPLDPRGEIEALLTRFRGRREAVSPRGWRQVDPN